MIESILDTDLYKFSTSYAYFSLYPDSGCTFTFKNRGIKEGSLDRTEIEMEIGIQDDLKREFAKLKDLRLTDEECEWCIKNIPYIPRNYWEWLKTFSFDPSRIIISMNLIRGMSLYVDDTPWKASLYEIPVLAIYAELRAKWYQEHRGYTAMMETMEDIIEKKIEFANSRGIKFSEFGTRRRYSSNVQDMIVRKIKEKSTTCVGTSNVYFAKKYKMVPIGTFPHEWIMFHAGIFGYKQANNLGLEDWRKVYGGRLGIALVDTYTTKSFLETLTYDQATSFSGFRQDSGDEFAVATAIMKKLRDFGIDPKSKAIVFSNALDFKKAEEINDWVGNRMKCSFGIGTNLTCDTGLPNFKPANIVMKMSECWLRDGARKYSTIKISDDTGKRMGDDKEFDIARHELGLEN